MKALNQFCFLLLTLSFAGVSYGEIVLGSPVYSGSGCPRNSVEIVPTPDQEALSVLFSEFSTTAAPRTTSYSQCNLSIPIMNIPNDKMVLITQSDFQGFLSLPKNAYSYFQTSFKLRRNNQVIGFNSLTSIKKGPYEDNFFTNKTQRTGLNSGCGGSIQLEINTQIRLFNSSKESASYTLDLTNVVAGRDTPLKIQLVNCRP